MRWVTVSPKDQLDLELTFILAHTEAKQEALEKQTGAHVFLTLQNDDCKRDYAKMKEMVVKFYSEPSEHRVGH